jgi:hypothetical protein
VAEFTAEDLAAIFGDVATRNSPQEDLEHQISPIEPSPVPPGVVAAEYAWVDGLHLVRGYEGLIGRYPPVTERQDREFGRVVVVAYLEDKKRRIRRNSSIGNCKFFEAPSIKTITHDHEDCDFRIVLKVLPYRVGTQLRFWENTPKGDVLAKSVSVLVTQAGLKLAPRRSRTVSP